MSRAHAELFLALKNDSPLLTFVTILDTHPEWINIYMTSKKYDDNWDFCENEYNLTPIMWALHLERSPKLIKFLIERGADKNQEGTSKWPMMATEYFNVIQQYNRTSTIMRIEKRLGFEQWTADVRNILNDTADVVISDALKI